MEESPLPCELLILLKLVMNGSNHAEPSFSLPVKALAQIILYNHKIHGRRRESSGEPHQRHKADKESPILPYIGLKVFSATRSSVIIDILHAHGLCVSYGRILRITQGLREALLQHFHDDNADISISWNKYVIVPSSFNYEFERNYKQFVKVPSSRSKKVGDLSSFYSDVEEIDDPPQAYYFTVNTSNIPENVNNSDFISIMKKREWLEQILSLNKFTSDFSWSVYNARNYDTETLPCVNSILPLLRKSVATCSMQKHCIEVAKNAIDALNLGQVTVDTSHQSVCDLSRLL